MYNKLKKLLAMITILFIALLGLLFLKNYQNQLFGGQKEVVSVEKSTVNFKKDIKKIAEDNDNLIAQRIVEAKNNFSGEVENTYVPIGKGELPSNLPLQKNKKLIKNSPVNTLYIIVKGRLTVKELAKKLNALNNQAIVFPTNYRLILLKLLSSIPQVLMIILVLLIAFSSLILAEYISNIRSTGIRRLSGEGKHTIALQSTYKDSLFLIVYTLVILFSIIIVLKIFNFLSIECFLVITFPILCWLFLLLIINFFLSNLFYYILQNQPINLSIKGKAPMKLIYLMVFVMQIFTLASLMYCVYGAMK
ncbi:hypothetical protein [Melissococcus plutonius]|uniref:hypothetical protein n=1 Tax=Melissococcus plutonius TaxID=33970 RepID=UPI00065DC697|nr:hypothetical protein [Melissococcus plutonius]